MENEKVVQQPPKSLLEAAITSVIGCQDIHMNNRRLFTPEVYELDPNDSRAIGNFVMTHRCIRLAFGRGVGYSHYIKNNARIGRDIVIVGVKPADKFSMNFLKDYSHLTILPDTIIYVDDASLLSETEIYAIKMKLIKYPSQRVIMLG